MRQLYPLGQVEWRPALLQVGDTPVPPGPRVRQVDGTDVKEKPIHELLDDDAIAHFWGRVDRGGENECWPWTLCTDRQGYGQTRLKGHCGSGMFKAHRVALTISLGRDIASGMTADHVCHNIAAAAGECNKVSDCPHRRCCNPAHLSEQTQSANILSSINTLVSQQVLRTHCPAGHALVGDNLVPSKLRRGIRGCLECDRQRSQVQTAKRKAAHEALGVTQQAFVAEYGGSAPVMDAILILHGIDPTEIEETTRRKS